MQRQHPGCEREVETASLDTHQMWARICLSSGCRDPFKKDWGPVFPVQRQRPAKLVSKAQIVNIAPSSRCSAPHHTWMILCNTHILPA